MPSTRETHTTDLVGPSGITFDDRLVIRDINTAVITRIVVTHDTHLRSITVHYSDAVGVTRGYTGTVTNELTLSSGEYITGVEGTYGHPLLSKIEFATSEGRKWGPFGFLPSQSTFVWDGFGPGVGLLYLTGRADTYIRSLKATFGMFHDQAAAPAVLKYEEHITTDTAIQASTPQSKFTAVLTSPTVTLIIGTDKTKMNVSQHMLCRLPFFRAALQGNFREASEQTVKMPDDAPQDVTALVEYLYTGRYTYPYLVPAESGSGIPAPDLAEGLYHVGVYAMAHKYGCSELEAAALDSFMYVLERLGAIDVVRLWKGGYAMNLLLREVEDNENMAKFRRRLPGMLKELYSKHREEVETAAAEYPLLCSDFLRLVLSSDGVTTNVGGLVKKK